MRRRCTPMASCRSIDGTIFMSHSGRSRLFADTPIKRRLSSCRIRSIRASWTTTSGACTASDGTAGRARERRPAAPTGETARSKRASRPRDRRPRRAPEGPGPAGPKASTPTRPQGREGCIEARPSRQSCIFCSTVKFVVLVRAVAANDRGLLFGRRLHVREYGPGALLCERAAAWRAHASAMDDGKRRSRYRELARSGRPMPIPASCFRMDCRCRSTRRFRSRGCRLFRFRSAARHLWADRVRALTTAEEAGAGEAVAEVSALAAAATLTT